ncbi:MAG: hypothetical protein QM765_23795 [Myxococcales bacterium]
MRRTTRVLFALATVLAAVGWWKDLTVSSAQANPPSALVVRK